MRFKNPGRAALSLSLGMVALVGVTIFAQQFATAQTSDQTTAQLVTEMIARRHISHKRIDDDISERLLNRYLKTLDPQKMYFTQAEVADLQRYKHVLDDQVKAGNVDFAYSTFEKYLQLVDARIVTINKLIDADHDFTVDEEMVVDPDEMDWAKDDAEVNERWRKRIKYDLLSLVIADTELVEARKRLHKRYHNIQTQMHQMEKFEQLEMYLTSMAHCFDPHSSYMSRQTLEDFRIQMELKLQGIGAALRSEDGFTEVASIVPGGAADKDGRLKVGDRIIGVAQGDSEFVDVVEMKLSKVVRYIRGEAGTTVQLQVKTADDNELKVYDLTRQVIELTSSEVKGEVINLESRLKTNPLRVGVINIPSFYRDFRGAQQGIDGFKSTASDVKKVLADFKQQGGVDAIVVDLRTNGGGALSEAIEVSGLFINRGPVVQVKDQDGRIKSHDDEDPHAYYTGPLVVLCNRLSASASEIFAGAIKDYRRGLVVGDTTTHGKGTVQNVMPVSERLFLFGNAEDRGALKLTINQFYRVNGDSTQNVGVPSDIVLPSLIDNMDLGESSLDNALAFDQIPAAGYSPLRLVDPKMVSMLRESSAQRIAQDKEFAEIREDIESYLSRKNRKTISLNIDKLRAERDSVKKDSEAEAEDEAPNDGTGPVFPEGSYNDEVLKITADYVQLIKQMKTAQN